MKAMYSITEIILGFGVIATVFYGTASVLIDFWGVLGYMF